MKKILYLLIIVLMISCGKQSQTGQMEKTETERVVPVMVETIQPRLLESHIQVSGRLEGFVDIVLTAETSGKVTAIYKTLGQRVEKGEELGAIDNQEYNIQLEHSKAGLKAAEANFELSEMAWKTNEKLYGEQKISQMEFISAKSAYLNAQAGLQAAKANLERSQRAYDNSILTVPVSGYIADMPLKIGEFISPGKPLASILETDKLIIRTGVGESAISGLKRGQKVKVIDNTYKKEWEAILTGVGKKMKQGTAVYPIELELNNPQNTLLPGMIVQAKIINFTYENIFYTSRNNIFRQYDDVFVFIIDEKNIAHKRKVELGEEIADFVILESGVESGNKLVVDGIANLEEGTKVEIRSGVK